MNSRNILAICVDPALMSELSPLISQHLPLTPVTQESGYPDRARVEKLVESASPSLCFLDMTTSADSGLGVLTELVRLSPGTPVVAILSSDDSDLILQCLRMGATEFLIRPLSGEQFSPVLARLSQVSHNAPIGGARIISVLPVKGACGASTIALNLAFQWRRMGTRRILLADMDPATGIASFQLKIKSSYSFMDAISRAGTLDADLWKGLVTSVQGMDILLSPENAIDVNAELPDPTSVLDFCRQAYDIVVMDLGSAFSQWSTMVADGSDDLLLVSTNELPALRATQKVLQNLEKNKIDRSRIKLVINRYSPDVGLNQDTIQTALHTEVFHTIPSDYESVQAALVEGKAVPPSSTFGKSLAALAKQLGGQVVKAKPPAKKNSGIGGFFSSLVSKVSG